MILNFGNTLAEDIFYERKTKKTLKFPSRLYQVARRKLLYLYEAERLKDLRIPPNNKLKSLKGELKGYYSIRINKQWMILFKWSNNTASEVQIIDYH